MAKQRKSTKNLYRYFPNKDVNKFRFVHLHKKAAAIVSKTFNDLNHTETLLIVAILDYSMIKGVFQVSRPETLESISGNYEYINKLSIVWDALLRKGYLIEGIPHVRKPTGLAYRLTYKSNQVIELYSWAHEEVIKKYHLKYQKPITIAEYFAGTHDI